MRRRTRVLPRVRLGVVDRSRLNLIEDYLDYIAAIVEEIHAKLLPEAHQECECAKRSSQVHKPADPPYRDHACDWEEPESKSPEAAA